MSFLFPFLFHSPKAVLSAFFPIRTAWWWNGSANTLEVHSLAGWKKTSRKGNENVSTLCKRILRPRRSHQTNLFLVWFVLLLLFTLPLVLLKRILLARSSRMLWWSFGLYLGALKRVSVKHYCILVVCLSDDSRPGSDLQFFLHNIQEEWM